MKYKFYLGILGIFFLFSCKTKHEASNLNYMQNIEEIATEASKHTSNLIQPGDQLLIVVSAKDLDVVAPFNQNYSSGANVQSSSIASGNVAPERQLSTGPTYVVDSQGNIDFPVIGKLNTTGSNIEEFKNVLRGKLTKYIIDPTVNMRLTNYKITVLGEVKNPGEFTVLDGKVTILNALGMAGDTTLFGKRNDVLVVRNTNGEITKQRIDLTDANFINSPFFYLRQGDVIYVSSNQNREIASKQNPNNGLYISLASVGLGLLVLLVNLVKK